MDASIPIDIDCFLIYNTILEFYKRFNINIYISLTDNI